MDRKTLERLTKEVIREELFGVEQKAEERAQKKVAVPKARKKLHWTKRPENQKKVAAMVRKMQRAKKEK